jgi:hypothetical protein
MFCESYRQSLTDAAASGEALPLELAAHLAICKACAFAFAVEQATFTSIDHSLHVAANADVPASLVPRVRGKISEGPVAPEHFSWRAIFVPATAVLLLFAAVLVVPHFFLQKPPGNSQSVVSPKSIVPPVRTEALVPKPTTSASMQVVLASPKKVRRGWLPAAGPEVRVEAATQATIAQVIRLAQEQPDAAKDLFTSAEPTPIVIKPIEVASMAWRPLSDEENVNNPFEPRR